MSAIFQVSSWSRLTYIGRLGADFFLFQSLFDLFKLILHELVIVITVGMVLD